VAALKRARTVDAAVQLFYEYGYEKTTLEAVADRLGVTRPFIYSHFSSKAEPRRHLLARKRRLAGGDRQRSAARRDADAQAGDPCPALRRGGAREHRHLLA
jgi:AcrR family transcriptional regulator